MRGHSPKHSSEYRGVSWDSARGKWVSSIKRNRKTVHLGRFDDEVSAAKAYDLSAVEMFGRFASPNFPAPGSEYADKTTQVCTKCGDRKRLDLFPQPAPGKAIASWCLSCRVDDSGLYFDRHREETYRKNAERRAANPVRAKALRRKHEIKYKYGVPVEIVDRMIAETPACPICGRAFGLGMSGSAVDHDHDTGAIRGILCRRCNAAIGALGDSIAGLGLAIEYLRNSRRTQ